MIIWLVYAQLLYLGFRRQRNPRLIINRGRNKDINALCLISNKTVEKLNATNFSSASSFLRMDREEDIENRFAAE